MKQKLKILVVDDDKRIGQLFQDVLQDTGNDVEFASSGEECMSMVKDKTFDLIFLDMVMPGMNGLETLKALKSVNEQVKVVVMTGFSVLGMLESAEKSGALSSLIKPFSIARIQEVVDEIYAKDVMRSIGRNRKALLVTEEDVFAERLTSLLTRMNFSVDICRDIRNLQSSMKSGAVDLILIYTSKWDNDTLEKLNSVRKFATGMQHVMLVDDYTEPEELSKHVHELFQ